MYNKSEDKMIENATNALENYALDNFDHVAGNNVIRYYKKGLYSVKNECVIEAYNMAFEWYPRNLMYIVLRMAMKEMLEVSEKNVTEGVDN